MDLEGGRGRTPFPLWFQPTADPNGPPFATVLRYPDLVKDPEKFSKDAFDASVYALESYIGFLVAELLLCLSKHFSNKICNFVYKVVF